MGKARKSPPIVVIYGDDPHRKSVALTEAVDALLPPGVDRALALTAYEGGRSADQGGPTPAAVFEDLATLPLLADRRVVVIRDADSFISAQRDKLERYLDRPSPTGVLVLECRTFPKTTRLHKAALAVGGVVRECQRLRGRGVLEFVLAEAAARGKRVDREAADRVIELVGPESGVLASELEKLALYIGDRPTITLADVSALVGQSREERIFEVMDAAGLGRLPDALRLWEQTLVTDPHAVFRAVGGVAFVLRKWLQAHQLVADGLPVAAVAPKVMMWGRERELQTILRRLPARRLRRALAAVAQLDAQAKSGARSIERGIELILVRLAAPAA